MNITIRLTGPVTIATVDGVPIFQYRLKSIHGAVTAQGRDGEHRPGDLLTEDQAKGLAMDYEITTEEYLG